MNIKILDNETTRTIVFTAFQEETNDSIETEIKYEGKNKYDLIKLFIAFVENIDKLNGIINPQF